MFFLALITTALNLFLVGCFVQAVAVHCARGMGRTGTMLACYLVKTTGCTAEEAIDTVRQKRPGSIETPEQEECIRQVHKMLKKV